MVVLGRALAVQGYLVVVGGTLHAVTPGVEQMIGLHLLSAALQDRPAQTSAVYGRFACDTSDARDMFATPGPAALAGLRSSCALASQSSSQLGGIPEEAGRDGPLTAVARTGTGRR